MPPDICGCKRMMNGQLQTELNHFIDGKTCVLGIGNRLWGDDGVGSVLAEALEPCAGLAVVDGGFIPENHLESVIQTDPNCILMVDATDFGGKPGEARLLYPDKIAYTSLSTHAGSLRMLSKYLQARTDARIAVLAIQPSDTCAGTGLTVPVRSTLQALVETIPAIICKAPPA